MKVENFAKSILQAKLTVRRMSTPDERMEEFLDALDGEEDGNEAPRKASVLSTSLLLGGTAPPQPRRSLRMPLRGVARAAFSRIFDPRAAPKP